VNSITLTESLISSVISKELDPRERDRDESSATRLEPALEKSGIDGVFPDRELRA
jgi:hypothetical protein